MATQTPKIGEVYSVVQLESTGLRRPPVQCGERLPVGPTVDYFEFVDPSQRLSVFAKHIKGADRVRDSESKQVVAIFDLTKTEGGRSRLEYLDSILAAKGASNYLDPVSNSWRRPTNWVISGEQERGVA